MTEPSKFWDGQADKYARQPIENPSAYEEKLSVTQSHLTPQMNVLEFGAGTGTTALKHAPFVKSYTAIDYSARMVEISNEKLANSDVKNLTFLQTTLDDPTFKPESFDAILGLSILHLVPDAPQTLRRAYELLKPRGLLITSTGCTKDVSPIVPLVLPVLKFFGKAPMVHNWSGNEVIKMQEDAGFTIIHNWRPDPKSSLFLIGRK